MADVRVLLFSALGVLECVKCDIQVMFRCWEKVCSVCAQGGGCSKV